MPIEVLIKTLFILSVVVGALAPVITWIERKQSAVMQDRIGANRADLAGITILGLLHPAADVIKLMTKEDVVPIGANRVLHLLSPLIAAVPAIIAFAVIPYGGVYQFGETTINLVGADIDWGLLYIFAIGSIAAYGTVIAGWSSNNNWSMLGGLRASAQMISYEVVMGLTVVGVFMVFETLRLTDMALAQDTSFRIFGFLNLYFGLDGYASRRVASRVGSAPLEHIPTAEAPGLGLGSCLTRAGTSGFGARSASIISIARLVLWRARSSSSMWFSGVRWGAISFAPPRCSAPSRIRSSRSGHARAARAIAMRR